MRRNGHPSRPKATTCCFFASLKTLLIPTKANALRRNQRPQASFSLAGFEVTLIGCFWVTAEVRRPDTPLATRLTQSNKRAAEGKTPPAPRRAPQPQNICLGCGKEVAGGSMRCAVCAVEASRTKMLEIAKKGRVASKTPESKARLATTQRRQAVARWNWNPKSQPDWLTDDFYKNQIQPRLINVTLSQIASAIGVSILYASEIRRGRRRPHPRHWQRLAQMIGIAGSRYS